MRQSCPGCGRRRQTGHRRAGRWTGRLDAEHEPSGASADGDKNQWSKCDNLNFNASRFKHNVLIRGTHRFVLIIHFHTFDGEFYGYGPPPSARLIEDKHIRSRILLYCFFLGCWLILAASEGSGLTFRHFSWACSCSIWSSKQRSSTGNEPTYFTAKTFSDKENTVKRHWSDEITFADLPLLIGSLCHLLWLVPHPCCLFISENHTAKSSYAQKQIKNCQNMHITKHVGN